MWKCGARGLPLIGEDGGDPRVECEDEGELRVGLVLADRIEVGERHAVEPLQRKDARGRGLRGGGSGGGGQGESEG